MDKIKNFLLTNTNTKQTIIKNTIWLGVGEITSRLLKVAVIFYAIKILGSSGWGVFSYAISLLSLFMVLSDVGISSLLTREVSKNNPEEKDKYIATSFILKISLTIIGLIAILIFAPLLATENLSNTIIFLVSLILVFDSLREFIFALNRGMEKMESEVSVKIITSLLLIIFTYIFLIKYQNVYALALGYALGSFVGFVYAFTLFKKYFKNIFKNFSKDIVKPILINAWPFAFFTVLGAIMMNTDSVMLGLMKNESEVGFYATSQRIILFLYMIPTLISNSLLPSLSKQLTNPEEIKNITTSALRFINMLIIPTVLGFLILGTDIIVKLFGFEYEPTGNILKISSLSILFIFPALIMNSIIFIFNKHKNIVLITVIGTILNILINAFLIPKHGAIGASIATLISQFTIFFLMKKELNKIVQINIFGKLHKILFASVLAGILMLSLKTLSVDVILNILISGILYLVLLFIMKEDIFNKLRRNIKNES
jgi:O-antigen/teichoic acid export membrane protein